MITRTDPLFPYTTLFRSAGIDEHPLGRNDVVEIGIAMLVIVEMIEGPARPLAAAIVDLEHHIAVIDEILRQRAIADGAFVARAAVDVDHRGSPVEIGRAACRERVGQYV